MATLIRLLGDFDLAEKTMHEAFAAALGKCGRRVEFPGNRDPVDFDGPIHSH